MSRVLLCLALCLVFAVLYHQTRPAADEASVADSPAEALRPAWLGVLGGAPGAGFPAGVPWAGLFQLGPDGTAASDPLPYADPVVFLEKCLERYDREVRGYSLVMVKHERVGNREHDWEVVQAHFREKPFSVYLKWLSGARQAKAALWVQGQFDNNLQVMPAGLISFVGVQQRSLTAADVKESGRYGIDEFGLKKATERSLDAWRRAQARGALHIHYEGVCYLPKAGNRPCYKLHRSPYEQPEEDGITDLVLYIDTETWLQVGSILHGADGRLIGEYYFRDIHLNPTFAADQFTRAALKR
jgi:hypothetical protein